MVPKYNGESTVDQIYPSIVPLNNSTTRWKIIKSDNSEMEFDCPLWFLNNGENKLMHRTLAISYGIDGNGLYDSYDSMANGHIIISINCFI